MLCAEVAMTSPAEITVREVGVRDGLQTIEQFVPTAHKVRLIDKLSTTGLPVIQITSFVHPKWVPQMKDAETVAQQVTRQPGVRYTAVAPNVRGLDRAAAAKVDGISIPVGATDSFNRRNVNRTTSELLGEVGELVAVARSRGLTTNLTVSVAFGCPYEGRISAAETLRAAERLLAASPDTLTLGDTIGIGNPMQVREVFAEVVKWVGAARVSAHFHDSRGLGIANCLAALEAGCRVFDGSIGGLGGCPFAPGAMGNIATEEFVLMAEEMGLSTGIDLETLLDCARLAEEVLGFRLPGRLLRAGLFRIVQQEAG